jgi:hypothetical protein
MHLVKVRYWSLLNTFEIVVIGACNTWIKKQDDGRVHSTSMYGHVMNTDCSARELCKCRDALVVILMHDRENKVWSCNIDFLFPCMLLNG